MGLPHQPSMSGKATPRLTTRANQQPGCHLVLEKEMPDYTANLGRGQLEHFGNSIQGNTKLKMLLGL